EALLQRVQLAVLAEAFDGRDVAALHLHGQLEARLDDFAVDQHRAGAADAGLAAALGAGEVQVVAQEIGQQPACRHFDALRLAVHGAVDAVLAHFGAPSFSSRPNSSATVRRATTRTMSRRNSAEPRASDTGSMSAATMSATSAAMSDVTVRPSRKASARRSRV